MRKSDLHDLGGHFSSACSNKSRARSSFEPPCILIGKRGLFSETPLLTYRFTNLDRYMFQISNDIGKVKSSTPRSYT